jgi:hypothetical protein
MICAPLSRRETSVRAPTFDPAHQASVESTLARRAPGVYTPASAPVPTWSVAKRIGFRFVFAYLVLYNLPFPIGGLPLTETVKGWYDRLWQAVVPWFSAHVLHLAKPITIFSNGSGDTTYDYVLVLVFALLAALATVVWSHLDRRTKAYPRLAFGLRIYVRYVLAYALLGYGAFKVIQTQFPYPSLDRLLEPYGEFSPMGVVWSWMGISYAYNLFAGLAEMVSGFLLFFRRTVMLGGLLAIAVMSNVVMINFAFDVPVKLYSSHLLLMAIFLVAPDARRLIDACVMNRGMRSADLGAAFATRRMRVAGAVAKTVFVLAGVIAPLWTSRSFRRQIAARPPLYGIWEVDSFMRGREVLPALVGDSVRWRRIVFGYPGAASVRLLNDSTRGYRVTADTVKHTLMLSSRRDSSFKLPLAYARVGAHNDSLRLDGILNGDSLHVRLHRLDENRFLLVSRGYHWINEFPLNR